MSLGKRNLQTIKVKKFAKEECKKLMEVIRNVWKMSSLSKGCNQVQKRGAINVFCSSFELQYVSCKKKKKRLLNDFASNKRSHLYKFSVFPIVTENILKILKKTGCK